MRRMGVILESCISYESCKDRFEGLPGLNRGKAFAFKTTTPGYDGTRCVVMHHD